VSESSFWESGGWVLGADFGGAIGNEFDDGKIDYKAAGVENEL
jgi:hypothetical protein